MSYEWDDRLRVCDMSPDELLGTFDESVTDLGYHEAIYGTTWTDAKAAMHMTEAQLAAAWELEDHEEVVAWNSLKQTLGKKVDDIHRQHVQFLTDHHISVI